MDSLHLAIAFVPLTVYLVLLGLVNLSPRPLVTSRLRDGLALALALSGFMIAGPLELFLPEYAAFAFGPFVWVLLVTLYLLACTLWLLMVPPRLVIYNISVQELKPVLDQVVKSLDPQASSAEGTYVLPQYYVQFHVEPFPALRNCSLVAVGSRQSWIGWKHFERALAAALRETHVVPNPYGFTLIVFGLLLGGLTTFWLARDPNAVAQALEDMLRL